MAYQLNPPLAPRNGKALMVLGISRISTLNQDQQSLADQEALHHKWVSEHYEGKVVFESFSTRGSGEWLDRQELFDIAQEVATGHYDLVFMEDLGRYMRGLNAIGFCGACVDVGTRLIALNDHIDTARDGWEDNALFASWRHKRYNDDTSQRIKQRLGNRFKDGQVFQCEIFGYIKPPGCKSDEQVQKDPVARPIYDRWFQKLEAGASFAEIADWLNEEKVPTGRFCRSEKWTGKMVGRITFNPILKGQRERNRQHTVKHHGSGHRKSVKAPRELLKIRNCSHLAHIDPDRFDRVTLLLRNRNSHFRRKLINGSDPLQGRPKKRTAWPGQHCYCGICKRMLVYGAHGQNDHLVCRGALDYKCWNGVSFDGKLNAKKLVDAIRREIEALPNFDDIFVAKVREKIQSARGSLPARRAELAKDKEKLSRHKENLTKTIREYGPSALVADELRQLEAEEQAMAFKEKELDRVAKEKVELPSMPSIKATLKVSFETLAASSPEFARLMKKLIPRIVVYPHRLIDGGHPVLRAKFTLNLTSLVPGAEHDGGLPTMLTRELVVDLFEPPQREAYREKFLVVSQRYPNKKLCEIAQQDLGITDTAVQHTAALVRLMRDQGLDDPYQPLTAPPPDYTRMRRQHHVRFRFEPLDDFEDVAGSNVAEREAA